MEYHSFFNRDFKSKMEKRRFQAPRPESQPVLCAESMLSSSVAASDETVAVGARYNSTQHSNDSVQSTPCKNHDTVLGSSPKLASKFNSLLNHHISSTGALQKHSPTSHIRGTAQLSPSSLGHRDHHQPGIGRGRCSGEGSPIGSNHHTVCKAESQRHSIGGSGDSGGNGGGASGVDRRMNTNGFDRSGMTGNNNTTTESISPWHREVAVPCQSTSRVSGSTVLTASAGSHEQSPSIPQTGGPYYRPLSSSAFSRRNVYTTTGSTLLPFASPPLYVPQSTPHQLSLTSSPYYYHPSYPFSLSGGPFMGTYPPSYQDSPQSAAEMLERLNRQHPGPSQIPRYLPHIPQYSLTATTSPGPSTQRGLVSMDPTHRHESKSPKSEPGMRTELRGSPSKDSPSSTTRVRSPHHHPSGLHHHLSPHHPHKSPQYESGIRDPGYKVPLSPLLSGKEDSRRFTRPAEPSSSEFKFPSTVKHEEPPHKRHKSEGRYYMPSHYQHQRQSTSIPSSTRGRGSPGGSHLPQTGFPPGSYPTQPHYPPHFMKGSIIQLANGEFKRVEDLRTEDFVTSADISSDLKIDSSTVVKIEENRERGTALLGFSVGEHRIQVTVEATLEHPFFVFGQGWSACEPERTLQRFGLRCQRLSVGDVCISLTHKDTNSHAAEIIARQQGEAGPDTKKPNSQISQTTSTPGEQSGNRERERPPRSAPLPHRTGEDRSEVGKTGRLESVPELRSTDTSQDHHPSPTATSTTATPESNQDSESRQGSVLSRKRRWSAPDQFSSEEGTIDVVGGTSPQPSPTPTDSRTEASSPGHEDQSQVSSSQVKEEKDDSSDD